MLIVTSKTKSTAIDWPSVESFTFDEGELPNRQLTITTKSGSVCRVLNPSDEAGTDLNFEAIVNAWLSDYTAWRIWEGEDKAPPPSLPMQRPY